MIKLVYCLRRLPHLSREEFQRYWRDAHGPLVRSRAGAMGIRRYVQVHTLEDPLNDALRESRNTIEAFDGVAELWWDSAQALTAAVSSPEGQKAAQELMGDERNFIDMSRSALWVAEEHPFVGS